MKKKSLETFKKALLLYTELQLRCGDGTGNIITSHSVNCKCKEINKQLEKLENIFLKIKT